MDNRNHLKPVKIQDKNGNLTTRYMKDGDSGSASPALTGAAANIPAAYPPQPNWNNISEDRMKNVLSNIEKELDSPEKLWQNMDALTNIFDSKHGSAAYEELADSSVPTKLRDAWLNLHGVNINDRKGYSGIDGDGGYEDYKEAHGRLYDAYSRAEQNYKADRVNWDELSREEAIAGVAEITGSLEVPEKLWDNMNALSNALESKHRGDIMGTFVNDSSLIKVRDTWLKMHGANLNDRDGYTSIKGPDGFDKYRQSHARLNEAYTRHSPRRAS